MLRERPPGRRLTLAYPLWRRVLRHFFELFFPPACPWCGATLVKNSGPWACPACAETVRPITAPFCRICGIPFAAGEEPRTCAKCLSNPPLFDHLRGVVPYTPLVAQAIHSFKYNRNLTRAHALAGVLMSVETLGLRWSGYDAVIPVPLHPHRLRQRRFNQAALLLWDLPLAFQLPIRLDWLVRVRDTSAQANLDAAGRHENIKGAFALTPQAEVRGLKVLLVDDVASTGATLHECAKVLKKSGGAAQVDAAVVARALGES